MTWMNRAFFSDKRVRRLLWASLILSLVFTGWRTLTSYTQDLSTPVFVTVSMKSTEPGNAAVYYDTGRGFNDRDVSTTTVIGDGEYHEIKLPIPIGAISNPLRFDPPSAWKDEIIVRKMDIVDRSGKVLYDIDLNRLKPIQQIQNLSYLDGSLHFSVEASGNDPQIRIPVDRPESFSQSRLLIQMLAKRAIPEFIALFFICILLIYVWSRWADPVITGMVLLAILIAGWMLDSHSGLAYFRLSMKSAVKGSMVELYYDQGFGLSEQSVKRMRLHEDDRFHDYVFNIPLRVSHLRLDPLTKAGTAVIKKVEITDRFGHVLKSFSARQMIPANEIRQVEFSDEGLKVTTTEKASDPQMNIMLDEAWLQQSDIRPLISSIVATCIEWLMIFLLLMLSVFTWKRKEALIYRLIDGVFFQEKLPLVYLGCTLGLILAMSFISGRDAHPDEWAHIMSAGFYSDNWLPPPVEDPRVIKTMNGWGFSYLFREEVVYFLAGKFASLTSGWLHSDYLRIRLFNALSYLALVWIVMRRIHVVPLVLLAMVVSSQVWYIFSYFNGDCFTFFISLLMAWQIIDPDSWTRQYLRISTWREKARGGILFGVLTGLLLSSKMNFYIYIVFILFVGIWHLIAKQKSEQSKDNLLLVKKGVLIGCVALCISLPLVAYDQYVNDFKKIEKIMTVMERHALPEFKPSTMINDISSAYRCLRLKDRGVSLQELLIRNPEWRELSFKSFFGLYGNMDIHSDNNYYQAVTYTLGIFFAVVFYYMAFRISRKDMIFILFVFLFAGLAVAQSVYNSWVVDYEPQGRYLFSILPMLAIGLTKLPDSFRSRVVPLFSLVFFLLSAWSFLLTALYNVQKIN